MKKITNEDFIKKSKDIHGDEYDYSLVKYINMKTKVKIICPIHGVFEQTPNNHLRGDKCSLCNIKKKISFSSFVDRSLETHGDKYDYSLVKYINTKTKVKIICPIHGVFEQQPEKHMRGNGCPKCGGSFKLTLNKFIKKSKNIHGDKYDYSLVDYINTKTKVKIICLKHGVFEQIPNNHINGRGCEKCSKEKQQIERENNEYRYSLLFIEKAKIKFKNKIKYYDDTYTNFNTDMLMSCEKHGLFEQRPDNHINSQYGCPYCADKERRIKKIKDIEQKKLNGYQLIPNYNPKACLIFDEISLKENIHIQHALNGGEYYIKELGYWVDGYDKENNVVYEFDEKYHKYQNKKDSIRQNEIIDLLDCEFIRIKEK